MDSALPFWTDRWQTRQIGFHEWKPNASLAANAERIFPAGARVLVPLCGKTLDLTWLAAHGYEVIGVEFVESAAREYFSELGVTPNEERRGETLMVSHDRVTIAIGDIFAMNVQALGGPCDAIFDRAAIVALLPSLRTRYVAQMRELTTATAPTLLVSFVHDLPDGPPYAIVAEEVSALYQGCRIELLDDRDLFTESPRFAERGAKVVREQSWWIRPGQD